MVAQKIDGKHVAASIRAHLRDEILSLRHQHPEFHPKLAVVQVGDREDSTAYVRQKKLAAEEIGIEFIHTKLPVDIDTISLVDQVEKLGKDQSVHGIIVQLPLPQTLDEKEAVLSIPPEKDVDGLHPMNAGMLSKKHEHPYFVACTPAGIIELLKQYSTCFVDGVVCLISCRS